MAADFVDSIDVSNRAVRRVQSLHGLIGGGADRFCDTPIDCVVRVKRKNFLSGGIKDYFAERNATQLLVFTQQPGNELIDRRLYCSRTRRLRLHVGRLRPRGAHNAYNRDEPNESHPFGFKIAARSSARLNAVRGTAANTELTNATLFCFW